MEKLPKTMVVTTEQHINISNQYTVHHKLIQCYMPVISQFKKGRTINISYLVIGKRNKYKNTQ